MWTDILIFPPMILALGAVGFVIWLRRESRKDAADEAAQEALRAGGGGGPTKPEPPK